MSTGIVRGVYKVLPLHLIDEPARAVRQSFNEDALFSLADDIRAHGLLQPLGVKPKGGRYEVVYGHRRRIALGMINALEAPCIVRDDTGLSNEAAKLKENLQREDVNPADEAIYLQELLVAECGDDVDRLCAAVNASREYVESRLLLLRGDEGVYKSLQAGEISFAVARELNMVKNDAMRLHYLDAAQRGGVSAKVVRQWRIDGNHVDALQAQVAAANPTTTSTPAPPISSGLKCICCGSEEDTHEMMLVYVHRGCYRLVLRHALPSATPASP